MEELKEVLKGNEAIKEVFFDSLGNWYFTKPLCENEVKTRDEVLSKEEVPVLPILLDETKPLEVVEEVEKVDVPKEDKPKK